MRCSHAGQQRRFYASPRLRLDCMSELKKRRFGYLLQLLPLLHRCPVTPNSTISSHVLQWPRSRPLFQNTRAPSIGSLLRYHGQPSPPTRLKSIYAILRQRVLFWPRLVPRLRSLAGTLERLLALSLLSSFSSSSSIAVAARR